MTLFMELGCRLHQSLSFSNSFTEIPKAEAVFWPGCSLMTLGYDILAKTTKVLSRSEPSIKLAAACCGKPTRAMQWPVYEKRKNFLLDSFAKQGIKRIYTACPNCTLDLMALGKEGDFEVHTIWQSLENNLQKSDLPFLKGDIYIHDPCPLRKYPQTREAVRSLLRTAGIAYKEPANTGARTICCGNAEMLNVKNPTASKKVLDLRLKDFPENAIITSQCQSCLMRFSAEGRKTAHVLELLFGSVTKSGWTARYNMTQSIKREINA